MNRPARLGVIGLGLMGERYGRILAALPSCRLAAVSDLDASRAAFIATRLGTESCSADALITRSDVDAICVCTPEDTHAEISIEALSNGKDVLIEKPLTRSSAEAQRIVAAADTSGRIATVGHLLRFEPHYAVVHQRVQAGGIGLPLYALAWRESTRLSAARYVTRSSVPMHLMVHDIDLLRWFSGAEVRRLQAAGPEGTSAAVTAILEFSNGMVATLLHSWALSPSTPSPLRAGVRIVGTTGEAAVDFTRPAAEIAAEAGFTHMLTEYYAELPTAQVTGCLRSQIEHFVQCVATRATPLVSLRDGLRAVEVAESIQRQLERPNL